MAVAIRLAWRGLTAAQYERSRERELPPGGVRHHEAHPVFILPHARE